MRVREGKRLHFSKTTDFVGLPSTPVNTYLFEITLQENLKKKLLIKNKLN